MADDELEAMIAKAFAEDDGSQEPAAEAAQAPVEAQEAAPEGETAEEKSERLRDEHGRFAKAEEAGQNPQAQAQEPAKTILPPRSWDAASKAAFATLPPNIQQQVLKREQEIDDGKRQWDTKAEHFNKYEAIVAPLANDLAMRGLDKFQYIQALAAADGVMRQNPTQGLMQIAQMYGLTPQHLAQYFGGSPQFQGPQPYADPQVQTLQQQLAGLQSRLEAQDKARETEAQQATVRQIEAFASDPAHLYFDNVRGTMAALIQANPQLSLQDAYDRACNADPEIRGLIAAASQTIRQPAQTKPAGLSVTGANKGTKPALSNGAINGNSIEDDVRAAIQELQGVV